MWYKMLIIVVLGREAGKADVQVSMRYMRTYLKKRKKEKEKVIRNKRHHLVAPCFF